MPRPQGWFVFETRRLEARDCQQWDIAPTTVELPNGTSAVVSRTVTRVDLPLVTFESPTVLDGHPLISASTLRFRDPREIERDLTTHGLRMMEIRDAPDRPGKELVVIARQQISL